MPCIALKHIQKSMEFWIVNIHKKSDLLQVLKRTKLFLKVHSYM